MANYSVHIFCYECSEVHPLGIQIGLDDGPSEKSSVAAVYRGKDLPSAIAVLRGNSTICPVTGRLTTQKDNEQVFLVPLED